MPLSASRLQSILGEDAAFVSRCKTLMLDIATGILLEAGTVPDHTARANYARSAIGAPDSVARVAAQYLARSTNVVAGGVDMTDAGIVAGIDDAGLLSQINAAWNTLAGIDANPTVP